MKRRPFGSHRQPLCASVVLVALLAGKATAQSKEVGDKSPKASAPVPTEAAPSSPPTPPTQPTQPTQQPEAPTQPPTPNAPTTVLLPGDAPGATGTAPVQAPAEKDAAGELRQAQQRQRAESAHVHLHVSYPNAWLEIASLVDDDGFRRVCPAPCDVPVRVVGKQARVVAPGMTPSNPFRIEPGHGTAQFRVNGGSERTRQWGIWSFAIGAPVALSGMGLWGYGKIQDSQGAQTAGIVVASVGAAAIIAALPLLSMGSTRVQDERGHTIASGGWAPAF